MFSSTGLRVTRRDHDERERWTKRGRKKKTERGEGLHEVRWIMSTCPREVVSEDRLMKQK